MKAFIISKYSKTEKFISTDLPKPVCKENEILIQVYASGTNQLDTKIKSGEFKLILPYKLPLVLGHDVAGIVTAVGADVRRFKVGDAVYSRPSDFKIGTFAEFIAVNENDAALKPENISFTEAASIPLVALTAWQALVELGHVKKGQKVFIQAGSGGVGTIAIQLAKYLGATVATTASAANFDLVKRLGADVVIDYKTQNFEEILKDYDLVLNSQDLKTLEKSLTILKKDGQVISISGPPTPAFSTELKFPWYMKFVMRIVSSKIRAKAKKLGVNYSFLFMKANGRQLEEITKLIESGSIKPIVDKIFPFEDTNAALEYVEKGRARGKVVIKMKD